MSGHEARINDALRQLGEEFRLGMVQAAEYRQRRRALLESWGERDATTSPGSLRSKTGTTAPNRSVPAAAAATPAAAPARGAKSLMPLVVVGALVVLAAGAFLAVKPGSKPPPVNVMPPVEPPSPQVSAVSRAADEFLAGNAWDDAGINRFLESWRGLDAADRARALEQPSMRTLRYKLDQNLQAESQVVAPDAPPEERQRLTLLEGFARELAGGAP